MASLRLGNLRGQSLAYSPRDESQFRRKTQLALRCRASDDGSQGSGDSQATSDKEELAKKLAAAEAEAEALRQELAARKAEASNGASSAGPRRNLPKIDGIGYRETIFAAPRTTGKLAKKDGGSSAWGFSEAELLQSEGGLLKLQEEFGTDADDKPINAKQAQQIVQRRLLLGAGLTGLAFALSSFELPVTLTKPTKPLFIYLVPLVRLQDSLGVVQEQAEYLDALGLRSQLKLATGSLSTVRDNLLNTAALLDGSSQQSAAKLAFQVLDYLEQTDYSKYFEGMGVPGPYQQAEYIKFSMQSLNVAQKMLSDFLSLVPEAQLAAAKAQLERGGQADV